MYKKLLPFIVLFSLLFSISCGDNKKAANKKANSSTNTKTDVKTGVAPVADNEIAVLEMAEPAYGTIKIELYSNIAPQMVERFKTLAKQGFYNGVTFHRVSAIVIQGGDPNSKNNNPDDDGQGVSDLPDLPAEFSDVPFERGIVGAARTQDPNSANCQFYITMKRFPSWDKNYTVFGKVIEGMNNADMIASAPTDKTNPGRAERPLEDIKIKQITFQPR
jgi:peptidylprolyl isomerase